MDYDEICYECTGYGDDYYFDEDGELTHACPTCPVRVWAERQRANRRQKNEEGE